jgi:hypothetical protein
LILRFAAVLQMTILNLRRLRPKKVQFTVFQTQGVGPVPQLVRF